MREMKKISVFYRKLTSAVLVLLLSSGVKAQQTTLFNTYSYDLMQLNVAAIGRTCFEANLNYRAQWLGISESPRLYQLNAGMALGSNNGVGMRIFQQSQGLLKITNVTGGYAYRLKLSETSKLHMGVGVSWSQNNFDGTKTNVIDKTDVTLNTNQSNLRSNNFDCEAGALYLGDKLTAGISALHLYNTNSKLELVTYNIKPQLNVMVAYKFNKGGPIEVEPWLVNRLTVGGANQPEALVNVKFMQMVTVGAGYRVNYGILALAGVEVGKLRVAYSFDYGTGKSSTGLGTSHQILLGLDLCRKKNTKSPDTTLVQETPPPPPVAPTPTTEPEPVVKEEPKPAEEPAAPVVKEEPKVETPIPVAETKPAEVPVVKEPIDEPVKPAEKPVIVPEEINPIATTIYFDKNSSLISTENANKIKKVAKIINDRRGNVVVVGYASPKGEQTHNNDLAAKRAQVVRQALIKYGVKANRLSIKSGGATSSLDNVVEHNRTVRFE